MSTKIEAALIAESRNHPSVYGDWWAGLEAMAPDVARVVDDAIGYDALVAERDQLEEWRMGVLREAGKSLILWPVRKHWAELRPLMNAIGVQREGDPEIEPQMKTEEQ